MSTADRPVVDFVVRADGRWWLTPVPGTRPVATDLDGVVALLGPDTDRPTTGWTPLDPGALIVSVWTFVGRATPDGLVVARSDGTGELLGRADLALLDDLAEPTLVVDLVERGGEPFPDVAERLGRLVALGTVRVLREATSDHPAPDAPPTAAPSPAAQAPSTEHRPSRLARLWSRRPGRQVDAPVAAAEAASSPPPVPDPEPEASSSPEVDPVPTVIGTTGGPEPDGPAGRIPVYAIWHPETGPLLSLGMLTAAARHHLDGALTEVYEIRRPETAESFLADLATRTGPAILLSSDYVWCLENNLAAARAGLEINPELVVLHGGPSCPKYEGDAEAFLDEHGAVAHVLTRAEGEHIICELLSALAPTLPELDPAALGAIEGITFRDPTSGATVRTPDRARITDLDALPSPYLTGEFDHIPVDQWLFCISIETNRGCPYSCSYCDWGSSTLSRVRKFSLDRVQEEIEWAALRGAVSINLPDANFGIMSRDVDTAARIADVRRRTGFPQLLSFYPAKNTTKHLIRIMDVLVEGGVGTTASISLQTTDEATLEAIDRANISTDHYVALASSYRRRGFPIQGDLLIGLPGQTYASYRADLQFNLDHEIQARTWQLKVLPNAPMNDPAYRERHQIRSDSEHRVRSTATFSERDRDRMLRLRDLDIICERLVVLRHILRWVQWDHGIQASEVLDRILDITEEDPLRYPHLTWVVTYFEHHATSPAGWDALYREIASLLRDDLGVAPSTAFDTAFAVNRILLPEPGRTFPQTIELAHDYVTYYREATRSLYLDGHATGPPRPLDQYGPATFTVVADPLDLCTSGLHFPRPGEDDSMESDFSIGANSANELLSPLTRLLPHLLTIGVTVHDLGPDAPSAQGLALDHEPEPTSTPIALSSRR